MKDHIRIDEIRKKKISPPENIWNRIEEKLSKKEAKNKLRFYRYLSIAASFTALLCFTILMDYQLDNSGKQNTFATNHYYTGSIVEELPIIKDDPFYNIKNLLHYNKTTTGSIIQSNNKIVLGD